MSPSVVYHYTSQEGLIGILSKREIWATKIHYLNDSEEMVYPFDITFKYLESYNIDDDPCKRKFYNIVSGTFTAIQKMNIFISSFSEKGDLLSQWRGYCPNGGGYSLGFKVVNIRSIVERQGFAFKKCIYDIDKQKNLIETLIDESWKSYCGDGDSGWGASGEKTREFLQLAARIKHPAFEEEKEWRIISEVKTYDDRQVAFRPGDSMILPYFKVCLAESSERLPISKIFVGPTPHGALSEESVFGLLYNVGHFENEFDLESIDFIESSSAPYRTW